jgi:anti-sigma B factor antagonist
MGSAVDLVRELWRAQAAGGIDAVLAVAGDDVIWQPYLTDGRVLRGSDELRAGFAELAAAGVDYDTALDDVEEQGNVVLATGTVRVRRDGAVEEVSRCWAFHFRSGRLKRQSSYATREEAREAVAALRALNEGPFQIAEEEAEGEDLVVRLAGELDVATAPDFERVLMRQRPPHQLVVLDLAELRFMDSTGLRVLLQARRAAADGHWRLELRSVPPNIRRLFELSGVSDAIPTQPDDPDG